MNDYFRMLFAYNAWANNRVRGLAATVSERDYFADAPGLSFGSLHATLVHLVIAELVWVARWDGVAPPERLHDARQSNRIAAEEVRTFEELVALWTDVTSRVERFVAQGDLDVNATISYTNLAGEPNSQPLGELIAHFINHGTQFRSEAAVRLTQLGASPGDLDLIVFLRERSSN